MNTQRVAAALNTLSLGIAELAEAIQSEAGERPEAMAATPAAMTPPPDLPPSFDELPPDDWGPGPLGQATADADPTEIPAGSLSMCPKHHVLYKDGKYGKFCSIQTDDEAWGKARDGKLWCKITPRNAAEYLRIKAAA